MSDTKAISGAPRDHVSRTAGLRLPLHGAHLEGGPRAEGQPGGLRFGRQLPRIRCSLCKQRDHSFVRAVPILLLRQLLWGHSCRISLCGVNTRLQQQLHNSKVVLPNGFVERVIGPAQGRMPRCIRGDEAVPQQKGFQLRAPPAAHCAGSTSGAAAGSGGAEERIRGTVAHLRATRRRPAGGTRERLKRVVV